jgi:hypothetical protein
VALASLDVQLVQESPLRRELASAQLRMNVFGSTSARWPGQSNTTICTDVRLGAAGRAVVALADPVRPRTRAPTATTEASTGIIEAGTEIAEALSRIRLMPQ